jgi:hypothetical protein
MAATTASVFPVPIDALFASMCPSKLADPLGADVALRNQLESTADILIDAVERASIASTGGTVRRDVFDQRRAAFANRNSIGPKQ